MISKALMSFGVYVPDFRRPEIMDSPIFPAPMIATFQGLFKMFCSSVGFWLFVVLRDKFLVVLFLCVWMCEGERGV